MEKYKHLDKEYKNRYTEFYLKSGIVLSSRDIYWRDVNWEEVVAIKVHIRHKTYRIDKTNKTKFEFFMNFRSTGQISKYNENTKKWDSTPIRTWTVGFCDGEHCFLSEIDFITGELVREYIQPVSKLMKHVHPRVLGRITKDNGPNISTS